MTTTPTIPQVPDPFFGLKTALDFSKDPIGYFMQNMERYGDLFRSRFGPFYTYLLSNPDHVHDALLTYAKQTRKWPRQADVFAKVAGQGTFTSEGDFWRRQRKLIQPAFHTNRIAHYSGLIIQHTIQMFSRWGDGGELEINHEMTRVTMAVIADILFDIKDTETDAQSEALIEAFTVVNEMIGSEGVALMPVPDWVPTPRNLRENRAMKFLEDYVMTLIRQRRASGEDRGDVLSALIAARDDDGSGMSDQQIYDELITLFIAGHETTSMLLTWTLYLLAQNTDIQDKLRVEVRKVLATNQMPARDVLDTMTYIEQVLRESMRVYPPAWALVAREALEDLKFGEYVIPKGHILVISPWVLHHDPKNFPDPWKFDPERFAEGWKQRIPTYAYIPFGAGPRVCSGQHLAMFEAQVLLATMIERYTFTLVSNEKVAPEPLITIRPKGGLHLKVSRR